YRDSECVLLGGRVYRRARADLKNCPLHSDSVQPHPELVLRCLRIAAKSKSVLLRKLQRYPTAVVINFELRPGKRDIASEPFECVMRGIVDRVVLDAPASAIQAVVKEIENTVLKSYVARQQEHVELARRRDIYSRVGHS